MENILDDYRENLGVIQLKFLRPFFIETFLFFTPESRLEKCENFMYENLLCGIRREILCNISHSERNPKGSIQPINLTIHSIDSTKKGSNFIYHF